MELNEGVYQSNSFSIFEHILVQLIKLELAIESEY